MKRVEFDPTIDINRLDEEWLKQPLMYHTTAEELGDARLKEQEAKQALELTRAQLYADVYERPDKYDCEKLTVDNVNNAVIRAKRYQEAQKAYNEAKHEADLLAAAIATLDHRRRALENLVELHGRDYFSTPQAKSEGARRTLHESQKKNVRKKGRQREEDIEDDEDE